MTLPPGFAKLVTSPLPTGSPTIAMTIGIERVDFFAAAVAKPPSATMTSTPLRTMSAASSGKRAESPSENRLSNATLLPST